MKTLLSLVLLCVAFSMEAQLDRRLAHAGQPQVSTAKPEKVDYHELAMKKLKEELTLDAFQEAAISNLLKENMETEAGIIQLDVPRDSKLEKLTEQRNKLNSKIKELLTPEQIEKFDKFSKKKKK